MHQKHSYALRSNASKGLYTHYPSLSIFVAPSTKAVCLNVNLQEKLNKLNHSFLKCKCVN